ncbi:MAG TPA: response regulator [Polyangiaceae bacterium]|nr:response regulator [Polyangiaceae bacterium]
MAAIARQQSKSPWVLVVDDDPVAARATARAVSGATGARVALVADVDSALRLATRASVPPAAAILDFELAGGATGLSVLMSLRANGCDAPCAFHTGAPDAALEALEKSRIGDGYPVFDKGDGTLISWLARTIGIPQGSHTSGVRRKVEG